MERDSTGVLILAWVITIVVMIVVIGLLILGFVLFVDVLALIYRTLFGECGLSGDLCWLECSEFEKG